MKWKTYLITFFAYVAVHVMRMSYSFNKSKIKLRYGIDPYFLGILDSIIYLAIGMGFFFRYKILKSKKVTKNYLITAIIVSSAFSIIPLCSLLNIGVDQGNGSEWPMKIFISISLIIYGFFQFSFWPITLGLVNQYFNPKTQGTILGLWSANGDFGNIIGFFIPTLMVTILHSRWQISLLFGAAANVIMGTLIFACLKMKNRQNDLIASNEDLQNPQNMLLDQQGQAIPSFSQFWQFTKQMFKNTSTCLYLLCTGFYKAILYGFLLWCPIFLQSVGHKNFSGYIPMMFNASTLIGSLALGTLYKQKVKNNQKSSIFDGKFFKIFKNYKLFVASIFLFVTLVLFRISQNVVAFYAILSFLMGFVLGGIFNMLVTHQIMVFTQGQDKKTDLMSTLAMTVGNISVGLLELAIALALHRSSSHEDASSIYNSVFDILLVASILATILTFVRTRITSSSHSEVETKNKQVKSEIRKRQETINESVTTDFYP